MFDSDLSFDYHIDKTAKSAYKMLGFIIRNADSFSDVNVIKSLYYAFVRSKLEYCAIVWNPYYDIYKQIVENIQRKFFEVSLLQSARTLSGTRLCK